MYGVPEQLDLSAFVGATLTQIEVSRHEVRLNFDDPVLFVQFSSNSRVGGTLFNEPMEAAREIIAALAEEVVSVRVLDRSAVQFVIGSVTIEVHDSSPRYESFQIGVPGRNDIVV